ncbi:MAG: 4-hydroxythreonine-4-phosphate dehydrogenase PdxA, partial [Leptospiraceae bacterium]|nr:4-hydroxythreonine-4-phosphate dehydrogenase PdxA [Leptospiraceae bacterium]
TTEREELDSLLKDRKRRKPLFLYLQESKAIEPGKSNAFVALRSYQAFRKALALFLRHPLSALVTLPVSKELILKAGVDFTGHTEELAKAFGVSAFMCMYHPRFSVIPLTNHIPLGSVPRRVLELSVSELARALQQFRLVFRPKRRFAWCGLNPHCGENGRIGNEEQFIRRAIAELNEKQIPVDGPISADAIFTKKELEHYSLVIANYHDQGLIPFKALNGLKGVNTTLGLPRLRVSPDHGPAYRHTAAKQVDTTGVLASLQFALKFSHRWQQESASFSASAH